MRVALKFKHYLIAALAVVGGAIWVHYSSLDGLHGAILARLLGDDTRYAEGYTERGFRQVHAGMAQANVQALIGMPVFEVWIYPTSTSCNRVWLRGNEVSRDLASGCTTIGIKSHTPAAHVVKILGPSRQVVWVYTESPNSSHYRQRIVYFEDGRVSRVEASLYLD